MIVTLIQETKCSICGYPMRKGLQAWKADRRDYECQDCSVIEANRRRELLGDCFARPIKRHILRLSHWLGYNKPHKWSREARYE